MATIASQQLIKAYKYALEPLLSARVAVELITARIGQNVYYQSNDWSCIQQTSTDINSR